MYSISNLLDVATISHMTNGVQILDGNLHISFILAAFLYNKNYLRTTAGTYCCIVMHYPTART